MNAPARPLPGADATRDTLRALLPHVRRWLVRLLGRSPDLDDATQDALTEIARFLPRFEGRSKLETAAHKITVRVAYRYFRTHTLAQVALEAVPEPISLETAADERLLAREALARLQRALRRLPAKRRMAFALCAIEGLTPSEAAELAGTTAVAMRCRLVWARRELARMLDRDPYIAPYLHRASEDRAPGDLAPGDLAPGDLAPGDLAPDDLARDDLAPDDLAREDEP